MHTHSLPNGLRLVVSPRPVPLVALYLWLDAGSVDERPGEHGAAHFLEHMLFKGTPRRGVGEPAAAIEALGGDLNAWTSNDTTVLHATVEAEGWREALDVLADMAMNSLIDPEEVERERLVVLEEIRGYATDPSEMLSDAMQAAAFPDHPYGRPIVGLADEVRALPRQALVDFWAREWGPNRAILVAVGDVDADEVQSEAERLFGHWAAAEPRRPIPTPPMPKGPISVVVTETDKETRLVELQWRAPAEAAPGALAAELLSLALGDGPGGEVPDRLLNDEGPIAEPWASTSLRAHGGVLSLGFVPRRGRTLEAVQRTLATLSDVLLEGLGEDQVGRTRAGAVADFTFSSETVDGEAWELAHHQALFGDPAARDAQREALSRVPAAEVSRLGREILRPGRLVVGILDRDVSAEDARKAVQVGISTRPADPFEPLDIQLPGGPHLLVLPDDGDVVAISALMRGGQLAIPPRRAGLAAAWSQMITAGADGMSAGRFSASMDRTGGEAWGAAGRSTLGLHGRFPYDTAVEGLALALMALALPEWDDRGWDRVREELLHDAESFEDYPGSVAELALWGALYPGHPWQKPLGGTVGSLRNVHPDILDGWHAQHLASDNLVIAVTGRVASTRVRALVEEWLTELPKRAHLPPPPDSPAPRRSRTLRRTARSDQAQVALGVRGLPIGHPDRPASQVLSAILGAQGGRLFMDLRERRSLAYSVWAEDLGSWGGGVFETGLATDPERLDEATSALHEAIHQLLRLPPDAEEVARAARVLRGSRAAALQRATGRASRLATAALFELPTDLTARARSWDAVTSEDVHRVAHDLLTQPAVTVRVEPA